MRQMGSPCFVVAPAGGRARPMGQSGAGRSGAGNADSPSALLPLLLHSRQTRWVGMRVLTDPYGSYSN